MKKIQYLSRILTDKYTIKRYTDDYFELIYFKYPVKNTGFEEEKLLQDRNVNDEKLDNNISRARSKIFEYALCNDFDYFITLTLREDREDLPKFIKDFGQFIRDERKRINADIQYLLIPEQHKDGKSWHMHGLIKGIPENEMIINKYNYLDWPRYSEKFGYCSIGKVRSKIGVSKYITKYIVKALNVNLKREKEKKLYYVTRGLKTAVKVKEGHLTSSQLEKITFNYENEYIAKLELDGFQFLKLQHQLDIL